MRGGHPILKVLAIAYGVAGLLAILVVPASVYGVAGVEPDPLSGMFALLLGLPWTLLLFPLGDIGTWPSLAACTAAIALNFFLLWRLAHRKTGA